MNYVERQPASEVSHRLRNPDPFIRMLDHGLLVRSLLTEKHIMPNDENPSEYTDDLLHAQRIADETVAYLRSLKKDLLVTTGRIERGVIEAIRKSELAKAIRQHEQKLAEHDQNWIELAKASKGFNQITAALERMTKKK